MKKFFFVLFVSFLLIFNLNSNEKKLKPKQLWEKRAKENFWFYPVTQDLSSDIFKTIEINGSSKAAKDVKLINIDAKGNTRTEELNFTDKSASLKYTIFDYNLYIFSNNYYIKEQYKKIDFYNQSDKLLFTEKANPKYIQDCYMDLDDNLLIINYYFFNSDKKKELVAYNIKDGKVVYNIEYIVNKPDHKARIYFNEKRIVILEKGKDLGIYNLKDGILINNISDFADNAGTFDFYEIDNDVFFLSIQNYYIGFLSLDSGRVISSVQYKKSGKIDRLDKITVKKMDGYYYLFINAENREDTSIVCVDSNNSKVLWVKELNTKYWIEYDEYKNTILTFDDDYVYCIDKATGIEVWKSNKLKNIYNIVLIGELCLVKADKGNDYYAFNAKSGEVKWSFNLPNDYINVYNAEDKYLFVSDISNVYKIEIETGKILWKSADHKDIIYSVYDDEEKKIFAFYNNRRGVAEFDLDTGKDKWNIETKYDLVDIVVDERIVYFADKKTIYGVNLDTSEVFLKNELDFKGKIDALAYIKIRKQFVFFDNVQDLYFYDIKSNIISKKVSLITHSEFIEIKAIANYLMIIEINKADNSGKIVAKTIFTMVDMDLYEVNYSIDIGLHYYTNMTGFSYYYDKCGAYYDYEMLGNYQNYFIFFPRMELYKENVLIVQKSFMYESKIAAYQLFQGKQPSDEDIKNIEIHLIDFHKKLK